MGWPGTGASGNKPELFGYVRYRECAARSRCATRKTEVTEVNTALTNAPEKTSQDRRGPAGG